ncbi:MAG TPA: hypothetical protein VF543_12165 [Pyrinomonadaceae bacterium]|jgi:hypothetical protein
MERNENADAKNESFDESPADMVEMGGETTAAATGAAEIGAATNDAAPEGNARPVGEGTMVKVAGEQDSTEES